MKRFALAVILIMLFAAHVVAEDIDYDKFRFSEKILMFIRRLQSQSLIAVKHLPKMIFQ